LKNKIIPIKDKKNKKSTPAAKKRRLLPDIWLFLSVIVIALFSLYALFYLLIPQSPFIWDEAHHAEFAGYVYRSLQKDGLGEALKVANRLILWPPLHSVICALLFFPLGPTIVTARLVSLLFFIFSALLIFAVCRLLYPGQGNREGLLAVILFSTSPIVLFFASACMLETMGIFMGLAILWCYFQGLDTGRKRYFILLGLSLGILYLVKYNYALTLLFPLAIDGAIQLVVRRKKARIKFLLNAAIALIAMGVLIGIWFAAGHAREKYDIISYYLNGGTGYKSAQAVFFGDPLFYLRSLATMYTFSIWIFLLYLGGIVTALWRIKDAKTRVLLLVILVMLFLCTLGSNKQDRYLILAFPPITILTAAFVFKAYNRISSRWGRGIFAGLLIAVILIDALDFPGYNRRLANYTVASVRYPAARELTYSVLGMYCLYPSFLKQPESKLNPKADFTAIEHSAQDIWDFIYSTTKGGGALCCLSTFQEFSPHLRAWYSFVDDYPVFSRWEPRCPYFASVTIGPMSPYYNQEYRRSFEKNNRHWINFLEQLAARGGIRLIQSKYYQDLFVTVKVYTKTPQFNQIMRSS